MACRPVFGLSEGEAVMAPVPMKRWLATVHYKSEVGNVPVEHDIEELEELQELVEAGPDWNTIEKIEIVLMQALHGCIITIEEAEKL
jgi:hypothetical protein